MGWCYRKRPLTAAMLAYVVVIIVLMIDPRHGHRAAAVHLHRVPAVHLGGGLVADRRRHRRDERPRVGWNMTLVLEGVGLVALTGLYGAFGAIP